MANYGKKVEEKKEEVVASETTTKVVEDKVAEKPAVDVRPKKRVIDKNEEIACRSVVSGNLLYVSRRTNMAVEWDNYGDIEYMTVEELNTMKSQQKSFLTRPWIIIEDDEIVEYLGLRSIYDGILPVEDLEAFLLETDADQFAEIIRKTPKGIKELLVDKAREMVANEKLDSMRVIKVLNAELNIDLTMVQE